MKDFEKPTTRWSVDSWQWVTVTALLDFGRALWRFRNDVKFGKDKISAARKRREQLETRVTLQYENKPYLLPKFTHLFLKPLPDRLCQGNRTLSAWLRHLEAYIKKISEHAESSGGRQRDFSIKRIKRTHYFYCSYIIIILRTCTIYFIFMLHMLVDAGVEMIRNIFF